ncbi:hypothetical protein LCGC14_1586110 [marine sediment metagenome]|uniref:Uncharacterized protein n=1 Tax=marine sediment metagenome TaxID=412755 RepID=A0A0F9J1I5_9ZZZZ
MKEMTESGESMASDYLDELLMAGQVLDLAVDPTAARRTIQSKTVMAGLLIPLENASFLWKTFGVAEGYLKSPLHFNQDFLTGKMRDILNRARERGKAPDKLEYLTFAPQDYTIYHADDPPDARVVALHTKPEWSWFLLLCKYHPVLGENYGRMRVMRAVDAKQTKRNPPVLLVAHPVTIRTTWRALTNQGVIKRLKEEYEKWTTPLS